MTDTVNIMQAWTWGCPECKVINFDQGSKRLLPKSTVVEMLFDASIVDFSEEKTELRHSPQTVVCRQCEKVYKTEIINFNIDGPKAEEK